jgi:sulfane dehydrogenase subunit SoxC
MRRKDLLNEQIYEQTKVDEWLWTKAKTLGISRRRLIQIMTAGVGVATVNLLPKHQKVQAAEEEIDPNAIVKDQRSDWFTQQGTNLETRWENMYHRGYVVPNELFFVRNNNPTPRINPANWKLNVSGSGISKPISFSYDELTSMPSISVIKAIECAGNGRSFYQQAYGKEAEGTQWKLGGIGVAEWTGVPLKEVLDRAGLKDSAREVMPVSLDEEKVQRPIPVEKALEEDTLLVYAMNGSVLPADHGFPIRLLVPGWAGISSIKWVGEIQVSTEPIYTVWNTEKYILIGSDYPPDAGSPAEGKIITSQKVKSAFELAWNGKLTAKPHLLRGRSWSGEGKITKVEVSLNDGQTWSEARLRPPNLDQAWVRWDLDWTPTPGSYKLQARAADDQGNMQPANIPFNEKGYLYWGVVTHPVTVSS